MESQPTMQMQFLLLEEVQFSKVNDDSLFQWELVNVVDTEEEEGEESQEPKEDPIEGIHYRVLQPDGDVEDNRPHHHVPDVDVRDDDGHLDDGDADGYGGGEVHENDDDYDDDDDYDGYDLDDELVPWNLSNKLERQRMRKLGKRAFSKMHNSKRSPYLFVRPGCVRGKHGLGLKHNY